VGPAAEDDGWLSIISLDFRGVGRLTQNLYLTMAGSLYVLPTEGKVGFFFGDGRTTFARLAYEGYIGDWEYVLFDELRVLHRLSDILDEVENNEIAEAGRYRFGRFDDGRSSDYFDSDAFYYINRVGASFNGPLGRDLEASVSFEHFDYWKTLDFDHLRNWDRLRTHVEYSGMEWWVTPYAEYTLTAIDDWDTLHHNFWLGARARLSENLRVNGKVGYLLTNSDNRDIDQPIAEVGVYHELSEDTSHSLYAGVRNHIWEDAEDLVASYVRYSIEHSFGSRLHARAYTQYNDLNGEGGTSHDREGWTSGANFTAFLSDYTRSHVGIHYDTWDHSGEIQGDRDRLIIRAPLDQRLLPYLQGRLLYQYEDYDAPRDAGFNEHLYMFTLRHLF
jgi:hypothetical protein